MSTEKLQDAVGMVDQKLIERAEKSGRKRRSRIIRWTVPVAALLAIAIGIGIMPRGVESEIPFVSAHTVSAAKYPEMAKFTSTSDKDGLIKWNNDRDKQLSFCGVGEEFGGFISQTTAEFLTADKNTVFSPISAYMALSMLAEVAGGDTRAEILSLLGAESIEFLRGQAHAVWNANYFNDGRVTSILGNSIWMDGRVAYNKETLNTVAEKYYASSFCGTMGTEEYDKVFRNWLNEQTGKMLSDYVNNEGFSSATVFAIASTMYYRAQWGTAFEETAKDVFHSKKGDKTADFLDETRWGSYVKGDGFSAVGKDLVLSGNMWFILPDEGKSVESLLSNSEALSFIAAPDAYDDTEYKLINLSVPRFDVSAKTDLIGGLENLGVKSCFDPRKADFTPLADMPMYVSEAHQAARVKIDETGVEAASYTEIEFKETGTFTDDLPIEFKADRPFVFVITGSDRLPLFIGVVAEV